MKQTLRQIETSLEKIATETDRPNSSALALREPVESLVGTPVEIEVHQILADTAEYLENELEPTTERQGWSPSERFQDLRRRYVEAVDHHPTLALKMGRIADVFAAFGL